MVERKYKKAVANSHTLASTGLKFLQVATVASSVLTYFDLVVIGICEEDTNAKLLEEYIVQKVKVDAGRLRVRCCHYTVGESLVFFRIPSSAETSLTNTPVPLQIKYVDCGGKTGLLPYVLLRWAQKRLGKGWRWGLESDGSDTVPVQGLYYTEADNVLFMPRPDATKRAIRKFLHANGTHSYVAPQVSS